MREYLLAALAGLTLPLAFAPFGQFWIAPLAYAALLYLWGGATPWRAARIGFAFGCGAFGFGTYWTYIAVRIIGGAPLPVAIFLTAGLVAVCSGFVALAGYVAASFRVLSLGNSANQVIQLISKLVTAATLYFGARLVIDGSLTIGELVAFNMLARYGEKAPAGLERIVSVEGGTAACVEAGRERDAGARRRRRDAGADAG